MCNSFLTCLYAFYFLLMLNSRRRRFHASTTMKLPLQPPASIPGHQQQQRRYHIFSKKPKAKQKIRVIQNIKRKKLTFDVCLKEFLLCSCRPIPWHLLSVSYEGVLFGAHIGFSCSIHFYSFTCFTRTPLTSLVRSFIHSLCCFIVHRSPFILFSFQWLNMI